MAVWTCLAVVVCLLGLMGGPCPGPPALARADLNVTLLHSQDNFGAVVPLDSGNAPCLPVPGPPYYNTSRAGGQCYGGLARRSGVVAQVRSEVANLVLVDAGNANVGSLFYLTFGSEVIATYYANMSYDAVKLEVHDFVGRVPQIANFTRLVAPVPVVTANVVNLNNDSRFVENGGVPVQAYAVAELAGGQRVGYVGTTAANLNSFFGEPRLIDSTSELPAMRNTVALLQNMGINKIVVAVSGPNVVDDIVNQVPGIDVIIVISDIYGTNLTTVTTPTSGPYPTVRQMPWGQPVLVVATGANNGKFLGRLDLVFDDFGVIKSWSGAPILLDNSSPVDMEMHADIIERQVVVNNQSSRVVGSTAQNMGWENQCMFGECTLGLWTTDALRRATPNVQIAWYNGGSMYAPIAPGNITLGQILTAMPLSNSELHTCELPGEYIWEAMENSLLLVTNTTLNINQGIGRFLSVSGMRMLYNPDEQPGMRAVEVWLEQADGRLVPIDRAAYYVVATSRFVWAGGDGFTMMPAHCRNSKPQGLTALNIWLSDLETYSPINNLTGGRLTVTTTLSRRACLAADGQVCSGNGYCYMGACQCTTAGASGPVCSLDAASADSGSSDALSSGSIAGIVVGASVGGCCVLLVVIVVTALLASMRKRPAEEEWMIDFDELEIGDLLGRGGFGEVHKGRWKGTEVAVKTISAEHITREMKKSFSDETSIMSRLRHPNVVLFMAASTKPPLLCIVMEYMALGSLYDLLHNELVAEIPFQLKLKLMYQAAKGMHFLHSSGVAHRDLKSLNLLLDNKWNVKVADFGLTVFKDSMRRKGDGDRRDSRNGDGGAMVGSVPWMAPELLQEMPDADPVLADVYAYGIIMWEVFTRKKPFDGLTAPQVAVAVIRNDLRPTLPSVSQMTEAERQYVELLSSCWHRDMTVRPVFLDVMNDIVKIGNAGGSGTSGIFTSSTYGSSSSAGSSLADHQQFSSGGRSGNSASKSSAGSSSKSDYASGEVAPATKGGEGVPRRDVSFVVCDLARFDDVWSRDPAGADKAIGQFGKMVRLRCAVHGGHIFSQPSFHSGGTFMIAFPKPAKAALFALELQYEVSALARGGGHSGLLSDHARVSVSFRAGLTMAPADDRTRTTYEAKDYEDVLWLNTCCPPSAVVCSAAFRDSYTRARTAGVSENVGFVERRDGSMLMMREGEEPADAADHEDDSDSDAEERYDERDHSNVTRRDREAGVCSSNMCPWIINTDRIAMGERIGEGNYGQVLEGVYHGRKVAIKRLFNSRLDDEGMRKMRKEAAILSGIDHPRVVKLMGLSVADGKLLLVMELVPRGSLRALLSNSSVSLKWQKRLAMLRDAAVGIAFLHSKGIVHRDIKSSNLLVDDNLSVKVGDFGFATAKHDNGTMTRCGTPSWTAPEVLAPSTLATAQGSSSEHSDSDVEKMEKMKTVKAKTGVVSEKADVYSFGIVMWEVLTRRTPYEDGNMMTVAMDVLQGKRPKVPNDCPSKFAEIMQRCWHQKPHKRPDMDDVLMYLNGELKDFAPL